MPCTKKDLKDFYSLINNVINDNLSLAEAVDIFDQIYVEPEALSQLLETDDEESAVLADLAKHPTLNPLFVAFAKINPIILFRLNMMTDSDEAKNTTDLRGASSASCDMIDASHLNMIEPGVRFDESLFPYVNTSLLVDNSILDAFLFQSFRNTLQDRGIALMPTIRSTEPIDVEQLLAIKFHGPINYTINVNVLNDEITPVVNDHDPIVFEQPIRFVLWPVWISNLHYGLLILSVDFSAAIENRGAYIEPFSEFTLFRHSEIFLNDDLTTEPAGHGHQAIRSIITENIRHNQVAPLVQNLGLEGETFDVIFLGQEAGTNYCSDYVIAAIARLASGEMNLSEDFKSIYTMDHGFLSEGMVQKIRMLEINRFGPDYFRLQLPRSFYHDPMTKAMNLSLTDDDLGVREDEVSNPLAGASAVDVMEPVESAGEASLLDDVREISIEISPSSPISNRYPSFFSSKSTSLSSLDQHQEFTGSTGGANIIDTGVSIHLAEDPFGSVMMGMNHPYI